MGLETTGMRGHANRRHIVGAICVHSLGVGVHSLKVGEVGYVG